MNLTGKDLKAYRMMIGVSQRKFSNGYDTKRGTIAGYEWSEKQLPKWLVNKIMNFDPNFVNWCNQYRSAKEYLSGNSSEEKKKSWLARVIGRLIGK